MKVLLIEDEIDFAISVAFFLKRQGMNVKTAGSTVEADQILANWEPDIVVTDWLLDDESGLQWLRRTRQNGDRVNLPVMMISAKDTTADRTEAFRAGVDDYLVKPFSLLELKLRLDSLARRVQIKPTPLPVQRVDGLQFDLETHECWVNGEWVVLSTRERKLLAQLMKNPGRVVEREELVVSIYEQAEIVCQRSVDAIVRRLRKRLGAMGSIVESIRGRGYRIGSLETALGANL